MIKLKINDLILMKPVDAGAFKNEYSKNLDKSISKSVKEQIYCFENMLRYICTCILIPVLFLKADSLDIQYSIVQMEFYSDYEVLKIKVPCWLKTSELIKQIKFLVLSAPNTSPAKKTIVYVFKETDGIGTKSKTGSVFIPGEGFRWFLTYWDPEEPVLTKPSKREIQIYTDFTETILRNGASLNNLKSRRKVARKFDLTTHELDSIYTKVKYWWKMRAQRKKHIKKPEILR